MFGLTSLFLTGANAYRSFYVKIRVVSMKKCLILFLSLILIVTFASADFNDWVHARNQIQAASTSADVAALKDLQLQLTESAFAETGWKHYWQAYIAFRLINLDSDQEQTEQHARTCNEHAEAAIERGETSGESHALLASCLGRLAAGGMQAGMRYGSQAATVKNESILIAADNPRVLLLAAVSDYYTPVQWGGDIDRAERRLRQALDTLSEVDESSDRPDWQPRWGLIDAYGHLAIVLDRLGLGDEALALLDQAKAEGVESGWFAIIRDSVTSPTESSS